MLLIEDRELVDNILSVFGNEIETQIFAVATSLCRDVGRVGLSTATRRRELQPQPPGRANHLYGLGGGVGRALGVA